jgi:ABC-type bacteriocin/lantibiotic exporter with double-glycine peptidase domain
MELKSKRLKVKRYWLHSVALLVIFLTDLASIPCSLGSDIYCGPRVAQYVLQHYGFNVELVELVNRIQYEQDRGCSFSDLQSELSRHGLSSLTLRVTDWKNFAWDEPVVLHQWPNGINHKLGHFVVLMTSGKHLYLWDGLNGERRISKCDLPELTSGFLLVTSAAPIDVASIGLTGPSTSKIAFQYVVPFAIAGMAIIWLIARCVSDRIESSRARS